MAFSRRRGESGSRRFPVLIACALALATGLCVLNGCGDDDSGAGIVIFLKPWSIDFDGQNRMFFVESTFAAIWKFDEGDDGGYTRSGTLEPPASGGFKPWGLEAGTIAAGDDILFVSDVTADAQRLVALDSEFSYGTRLDDDLLLGETGGPSESSDFSDLRGVATLPLGGDVVRVFVADGDRVEAFDYDAGDARFDHRMSIVSPGADPCVRAFQEPAGLAVSEADEVLYVVDQGNDTLFRFTGIDGAGATCTAQLRDWNDPEEGFTEFDDPTGVAALSGQPQPEDNLVVVADAGNSRTVAFYWDGSAFQPTDLPDNFRPFAATPFDAAFDQDDDLWVTYPQRSGVGGPEPAP